MTTAEMQYRFLKILESVSPELVNGVLRPDSETILAHLNKAQNLYISNKYMASGGAKMKEAALNAFIDEFKGLVNVSLDSALTSVPVYYGKYADLPTYYMHYLRSDSKITRTAAPIIQTAEFVPNIIGEFSELSKIAPTSMNKQILLNPLVVPQKNALWIITDSYTTVSQLHLVYLATPSKLVLGTPGTHETNTCELSEFIHEDIVNIAVGEFVSSKVIKK